MALFNKHKKLSLDEILEGINNLSDEEKAKVKTKMEDLYKAEDEREIDKIEKDKAEDSETKDEKSEEVNEESEEIGKDVNEVEEEVETSESEETDKAEETEDEAVPEVIETEENEVVDANEVEENNEHEVINLLTSRVIELEKFVESVQPLLDRMNEYTTKQAKQFGYEGEIPGAKKDFRDMSTEELSKHLRSEI